MREKHVCKTYGDEVSDVMVWASLQEGDICALKTLFLRYYDYLFQYGVKLSRNTVLAEDCVHDLFLKIWDRRKHLGEVRSVKSYLWISLRRDVLRAMRGNKYEILTDDIAEYSPNIRFTPEEFIIHSEKKREYGRTLAKALNQLPPRQKEAIFLKFFNGMGYDEMEQIMSINYQTARNYVSDGVQTLKSYFNQQTETATPYVLTALSFLFFT